MNKEFYEKKPLQIETWEAIQNDLNKYDINNTIKAVREIVYDVVSYYSEEHKGIIYNGEYSQKQIEQATRIQQRLSSLLDLYQQIIISKREFDEEYLKERFDI